MCAYYTVFRDHAWFSLLEPLWTENTILKVSLSVGHPFKVLIAGGANIPWHRIFLLKSSKQGKGITATTSPDPATPLSFVTHHAGFRKVGITFQPETGRICLFQTCQDWRWLCSQGHSTWRGYMEIRNIPHSTRNCQFLSAFVNSFSFLLNIKIEREGQEKGRLEAHSKICSAVCKVTTLKLLLLLALT